MTNSEILKLIQWTVQNVWFDNDEYFIKGRGYTTPYSIEDCFHEFLLQNGIHKPPDHVPSISLTGVNEAGTYEIGPESALHATIKALEFSCENAIKRADWAEKKSLELQNEVGKLLETIHYQEGVINGSNRTIYDDDEHHPDDLGMLNTLAAKSKEIEARNKANNKHLNNLPKSGQYWDSFEEGWKARGLWQDRKLPEYIVEAKEAAKAHFINKYPAVHHIVSDTDFVDGYIQGIYRASLKVPKRVSPDAAESLIFEFVDETLQSMARFAHYYNEYMQHCFYDGTDESKIKSMEELLREFKNNKL